MCKCAAVVTTRAVIVHPAVSFYRLMIAQLRHQLRDVLCQWFALVMEERPRVLDRYAELFGALEQELQLATLHAAQVQRIYELVHAYYRRGEPITESLLQRICQFVKWEYRTYRENSPMVASSAGKKHDAEAAGAQCSRTSQLARLYRDLVKRLHPDREGDADLFERFWVLVQQAYTSGDLERLRSVHGIVCIEAQYRDSVASSVEMLMQMHRRLLYRLDYERRRMARLRSEEPLAFAERMDDPAWVAQRRRQLEQQIERQRRIAALAIEELTRYGAGRWEEHFQRATAESLPNELFQEEFLKHTYFSSMRG